MECSYTLKKLISSPKHLCNGYYYLIIAGPAGQTGSKLGEVGIILIVRGTHQNVSPFLFLMIVPIHSVLGFMITGPCSYVILLTYWQRSLSCT